MGIGANNDQIRFPISPSAQDTNLANWYHLGGQRFVMFFGYIYVSKARKYMMDFSGG